MRWMSGKKFVGDEEGAILHQCKGSLKASPFFIDAKQKNNRTYKIGYLSWITGRWRSHVSSGTKL